MTVVTQGRECLFGHIVDGEMHSTESGHMVEAMWLEMPSHYPGVDIEAFVVMPNHIHGIIVLVGAGLRARPEPPRPSPGSGQPQGVAPTRSLSLPDVVHRFKSLTTARYRRGVHHRGWPAFAGRLWQRNYFEHVIRDEDDLQRIRRYIVDNPSRWPDDEENPLRMPART